MENFKIVDEEKRLALDYKGSELILTYNRTTNRIKGYFLQCYTFDIELTTNQADFYYALRKELLIEVSSKEAMQLRTLLTR